VLRVRPAAPRGEAAIPAVSGKGRSVAEILAITSAVFALRADVAEPGHPDALADGQRGHSGAEQLNDTDNFVTGNNGKAHIGKFPIQDKRSASRAIPLPA